MYHLKKCASAKPWLTFSSFPGVFYIYSTSHHFRSGPIFPLQPRPLPTSVKIPGAPTQTCPARTLTVLDKYIRLTGMALQVADYWTPLSY